MDKSINPNQNLTVEESQISENGNSRYWQDCHQLLTLLPKEVWDHICSFLGTQDFLNLNNSSLFFRELFLRKRVLLLFPPVLEILIPKLKRYLENPAADYFEDVRRLLLESRATCKTWKRIIDNNSCILKPEEPKQKNLVQYLLSKNFTFKESRDIDIFLQNFQTTHPTSLNPSPGKYIDLHIRLMEQDYPQFINRISILLEKYGQHICTFEISIMFGVENPVEFHEKIVEWLNFMPNLENLLIYCFIPFRSGNVAQVQLERLPNQLTNLRKLAIETFVPPLSDDYIPDWSWMERYNLSKLCQLNDNLDFLKITIFNKKDANILKNVTFPLKTLIARYYCKENDVSLAEVFTMLSEKFENSLEDLRITFRVSHKSSDYAGCLLIMIIQVMRESFNGRLNLPNVRKFEINMLRMYCLDFLLGMKDNLEELSINVAGLGSPDYSDFSEVERGELGLMEGNQLIKFLGYQNKMLESNIWNVLPKLKVMSFNASGDRVEYRREDWLKTQIA